MKTFKQCFCEHFNCPPERYLREAFFRTLHPRARFIRWILYWWGTTDSLNLIHEAGDTTTEEELRDVIMQSKYDVQERGGGTLIHRWNLRVSGKLLIKLNHQVRGNQ